MFAGIILLGVMLMCAGIVFMLYKATAWHHICGGYSGKKEWNPCQI